MTAFGAEQRGRVLRDQPDDARRIVHGRRLGQPAPGHKIAPQESQNALGAREAAAGEHDEDALAGGDERVHLGGGIDLIVAGVGARIGQHYQASVDQKPDAVSH